MCVLNELLISTGAAKVDATHSFDHIKDYLSLEAEARRKGEGVWSYDPFTLGKGIQRASATASAKAKEVK